MRSNPVRFVLGLRCTFIYHHTLCLQIVVALLSLCICAGSLKHSLSAHVQKATVNLEPVLGRSAKDLANLYTYEQSHKSLRAAWERIYCKYFKHVCETALVFWCASAKNERPAKAAQMFVLIWKCLPWTMIHFCEILVLLNSCVSSIGSNQPRHLCSLARAFNACTQCTYRIWT